MKFFMALFILLSLNAFALHCDCEVRVLPPMTGSHQMGWTPLKTYTLEAYDTYRVKNQYRCRNLCLKTFEEDLPTERMNALLLLHSARLIRDGLLGYNCTGLTTLKYPVRVKASLGKLNLGTVADQTYVVNHEEQCF
jgi:hypothetical protein